MKRILYIGILLISIASCKKEKKENAPAAANPNDSVPIQITVNSNYKYPYVAVENTTDGSVKKYMNNGVYTNQVTITYSFYAKNNKKYRIYTYSTKNGVDTTLNMVDNKRVWNYLKVLSSSSRVYEKKDSVGTGTGPGVITSNQFNIN